MAGAPLHLAALSGYKRLMAQIELMRQLVMVMSFDGGGEDGNCISIFFLFQQSKAKVA